MSNAPHRSPSSCCTVAEVAGHRPIGRRGGEHERVDARRFEAGHVERQPPGLDRQPGRGAADVALADAGPLDDPLVAGVEPISSRSWLVSVFGGSAVPQPVITARGRRMLRHGDAFLQLVRNQAIGWRAVRPVRCRRRCSSAARRRTATGPRASPTWPSTVPTSMTAPSSRSGARREDAGGRADDEPLDGEEVLALEAHRSRSRRRRRPTRAACRGPRAWRPRSCGRSTVRLAMPVSTPPGPSSAKSRDAEVLERRAGSASSAPGLDSCAESRLAHSLPSWWGSASTLATTGTSVSRGSASAIALRSRSRAGTMYGVWKAPDDLQRHDLLGAELLGVAGGRLDAVG